MSGMTKFKVNPLSGALGAEITDFDIRRDVSDDAIIALRQAWNENLVVVLRNQDITPKDFIAFSHRLGNVSMNETSGSLRLADHPEIIQISNRTKEGEPSPSRDVGRMWHTDQEYTPAPSLGTLLWGQHIPSAGGDTMFANMYKAYETLSPKMREIVDGLELEFDVWEFSTSKQTRDPRLLADYVQPPVIQPAVRVHPETGRKAILVSERATKFAGMTREESRPIIDYLVKHVTRPENVFRHRWSLHDLVIWDNRCTLHLALADYDPKEWRYMLRTSLLGEVTGRIAS